MRIAAIILAFFLLTSACFSATIYVPDQYNSIQKAILYAQNGDTIIARPNLIYTENLDFLGKTITVLGEGGPRERPSKLSGRAAW